MESMLHGTEPIRDVVASTWSRMFGLEVRERAELGPDDERRHFLSASVNFTGSWVGTVVIEFSPEMARAMTARAYRREPAEVDFDQLRDVLGEVSNVVAGGLKKDLPDGCFLSLPSIVVGLDYRLIVPNAKQVERLAFESGDDVFQVTLLELSQAPGELDPGELAPGALLGGGHSGVPHEHRT